MYCSNCGADNEDNALVCASCGARLGSAGGPAAVPRAPSQYVPNYLVWAILSTIFCCVPFGIVAIVNAAKVNGLVAAGDYVGATAASDNAKKWCLIALIAGLVAGVVGIIIQIMAASVS